MWSRRTATATIRTIVRLAIDDRPGDSVALGRSAEDDRRQLDHTALGDPVEVHRLRQLSRAREPEVLRDEVRSVVASPRPSSARTEYQRAAVPMS